MGEFEDELKTILDCFDETADKAAFDCERVAAADKRKLDVIERKVNIELNGGIGVAFTVVSMLLIGVAFVVVSGLILGIGLGMALMSIWPISRALRAKRREELTNGRKVHEIVDAPDSSGGPDGGRPVGDLPDRG